jgi:gp45 sliding clamp, C terminal
MNLSDATLAVLKNFSSINSSILFREGNVIRTISPQKTIMASAEVDETFNKDFAIFDLPRFLGVISLFDNPELIMNNADVTIVSDKRKLVYTYADPSTFITPPAKDITFPLADISFDLKNEDLQKVQRAANVLQLPEIAVSGNGSIISLKAYDSKNPTADSYSSDVGETDSTFNAIFKNENLKIIPNDYRVDISSRGISRFSSPKVTYFIATESTSTFS